MPFYDRLQTKVTLIVEVDGHVLTFEETGKATGARYHGEPPPSSHASEVLEANIRGAVDTCIARAAKRSDTFLSRAYPVAVGESR